MPDQHAATLNMIDYYRQNGDLIREAADDIIKEIAPQPGEDPAETFAAIAAGLARDRDRAVIVAAVVLMRLAEILPPGSRDNPVYLAGYEQGRTDFLADRANGLARRGDVVETWIKRHRDEWAIGGRPPLGSTLQRAGWDALDGLLDEYRLHADTGTPLDSTEPMGPTMAGVTDDA